jgi:hypothetical protein
VTIRLRAVRAGHIAELDARGARVAGAGNIAGLKAGRVGILELEEVFAVDGAVGVEKLVGDVGQDRGTARGNATFGDENEEPGEKLVDVDGGVELGELGEELRREVEGVIWRLLKADADGGTRREVLKAKTKMGSGGELAAAFAVGETVLATALSGCPGRSGGLFCCNCWKFNGEAGVCG